MYTSENMFYNFYYARKCMEGPSKFAIIIDNLFTFSGFQIAGHILHPYLLIFTNPAVTLSIPKNERWKV